MINFRSLNPLSNGIILALLFFIAGGLCGWGIDRILNPHPKEQVSQNPSSAAFFDPLKEMRQMQSRMNRFFNDTKEEKDPLGSVNIFDDWHQPKKFSFHLNSTGEIAQREDDQFIYYDIDLKGQVPKEMKVEVQNGQVFISGQVESRQESEGANTYFSSNFHRSFPVPQDVDGENFKMEQEDNKIVIKFPKKAS